MLMRSPTFVESAMSYKDILVLLDPCPDTDARLALAAELARVHCARLFEGMFGGASHDLLHQSTMPVLMSN